MGRYAASTLLPALLLSVTACQSLSTGPAEQVPPAGPGRAAKGPAASAAWIGDTADLSGRTIGEHLQVSLQAYVDPAIGTKSADRPRPGTRRLGFDMALVNVGGKAYDAPVGKAWVVDAQGKRHPAVRTGELTTGSPLALKSLKVGEQAQGWLVFEVPQDARIVRLHCTVGASPRSWQL